MSRRAQTEVRRLVIGGCPGQETSLHWPSHPRPCPAREHYAGLFYVGRRMLHRTTTRYLTQTSNTSNRNCAVTCQLLPLIGRGFRPPGFQRGDGPGAALRAQCPSPLLSWLRWDNLSRSRLGPVGLLRDSDSESARWVQPPLLRQGYPANRSCRAAQVIELLPRRFDLLLDGNGETQLVRGEMRSARSRARAAWWTCETLS